MTNSLEGKEIQKMENYNNLTLQRDAECYFNWRSVQFNEITLNAKLIDRVLAVARASGLDSNRQKGVVVPYTNWYSTIAIVRQSVELSQARRLLAIGLSYVDVL